MDSRLVDLDKVYDAVEGEHACPFFYGDWDQDGGVADSGECTHPKKKDKSGWPMLECPERDGGEWSRVMHAPAGCPLREGSIAVRAKGVVESLEMWP